MPHTKPKILVADDDLNTLSKIYIDLLLKLFFVEVTNDAHEIIERANRFKPDILILNNDLPNLDAHQICAQIKRDQKIPILLLVDKHASKTAKIDSCSADEIVTKPIDVTHLSQVIEKLIATIEP